MSTFNFTDKEKQVIRIALSDRRIANQGYSISKKQNLRLEKIDMQLKFHLSSLTPTDKSILLGCLHESFVDPNEELFNLSEYNLIFKKEELKNKLKEIDVALTISNNLLKKTEPKYRIFSDSIIKIEQLLNSNQILYSITDDGKIYKAAILTDNKNGVLFTLDINSEPRNLNVFLLKKKSFMKSSTPKEVLSILNKYSKTNKLTLGQRCFKDIIEMVCG